MKILTPMLTLVNQTKIVFNLR